MENKYFIDKICDIVIKDNTVILSNRLTGKWIKIPIECYEAIKYSLETSIPVNKAIEVFEDEEDQQYFKSVLNCLDNIGLLNADQTYEFEIDFIPKVVFSITNRCNLSCEYCCVDADNYLKKDDVLSTSDIKRAIDKILKLKPQEVVISGGEPLVRDDFYYILEYIKLVYGGKVVLCTNATLIKEEDIEKITNAVYAVEISLDGYDEESCSKIRGKGTFAKVIENVRLLKKSGMKHISLSMVAGEFNEDNVDNFLELNESLGTRAVVRNFSKFGRGKYSYKYLKDEFAIHYYGVNDFNDLNKLRANNCWAGNLQLFVNHDGNIYLCPLLQYEEFKICHIFDLSDEIIKKVFKRQLPAFSNFDNIKTRNISHCKSCKINLFCTVCPAKVYTLLSDKRAFDYNCNFMKRTLMPKIWQMN